MELHVLVHARIFSGAFLVEPSIAASFTSQFGGGVLGVFAGGVFAGGVFSVFAGGVFAGVAFVPVLMKCLNGIHIQLELLVSGSFFSIEPSKHILAHLCFLRHPQGSWKNQALL